MPKRPVIFLRTNASAQAMADLAMRTARDYLLAMHGEEEVVVASSNRYSRKKVRTTLGEYVLSFSEQEDEEPAEVGKKPRGASAVDRPYLFGDNHGPLWDDLAGRYPFPPCRHCEHAGLATFGLGGENSGVTFHTHGPGFAEVVHGAKHWFLYPPDSLVPGLADELTMEEWFTEHYMTRQTRTHTVEDNGGGDGLYECEIHPGEVLYFPNHWEHGTLNTGAFNVFVSLFLDYSYYTSEL